MNEITIIKTDCPTCLVEHEPNIDEIYVVGNHGPPFHCVCCGKEICARQFAYGFRCGICDAGACDPHNKAHREEYVHDPPKRYSPTSPVDWVSRGIV